MIEEINWKLSKGENLEMQNLVRMWWKLQSFTLELLKFR